MDRERVFEDTRYSVEEYRNADLVFVPRPKDKNESGDVAGSRSFQMIIKVFSSAECMNRLL
jgi:hypothetical protein